MRSAIAALGLTLCLVACEAPSEGCLTDRDCTGSESCVSRQCVPRSAGCINDLECPAGQQCVVSEGRCEAKADATSDAGTDAGSDAGPPPPGPKPPSDCLKDADCPKGEICEAKQCKAGCQNALDCPKGELCEALRCKRPPDPPDPPGDLSCSQDKDCKAGQICEAKRCQPGCATSGCAPSQLCDPEGRRCLGKLGAACSQSAPCASHDCYEGLCVQSCGGEADCPKAFYCHSERGAKWCKAAAPNTKQAGEACELDSDCQSALCWNAHCAARCTDDGDCPNGHCRWTPWPPNRWIALCSQETGLARGEACSESTACQSGLCADGRCKKLCSHTGDCEADEVCRAVDHSVCLKQDASGACIQTQLNRQNACLSLPHGQTATGQPCQAHLDCKSAWCARSVCVDVCGVEADCPASMHCLLVADTPIHQPGDALLNACVPSPLTSRSLPNF